MDMAHTDSYRLSANTNYCINHTSNIRLQCIT